MKSIPRHIRSGSLCAAAFLSAINYTHAAPNSWNGTNNASWNTGGNWSLGTTPGVTDTVTYSGTTNLTQTLDGSYSVAGLSFSSTVGSQAYVINNGTGSNALTIGAGGIDTSGFATTTDTDTLTLNATNVGLGSNQTWTIANGLAATDVAVNSVISGAGFGFTKAGAGTLELTAQNTYNGTTNISGGKLALSGGNNRLATDSKVNFSGNSTLDIGSTNQTLASLTVANNITGTVNGTGTLTVSPATFQLGGTTAAAQTLNMAGLTAFEYNNGSGAFTIGGNPASGTSTATATLTLASGANTITAAALNIARGTAVTTNAANVGVVNLGQSNTLNADAMMIGGQSRGNGKLQFQASLSNPELIIRGTSGGSSRATIVVGNQSSASVENTGVVDLTTGVTGASSLNAMVGTLTVGQNSRGSAAGGNTSRSTGAFTMGGGTLDATTIVLGQINSGLSNSGASSYAHGTFTLGGGSSAAGVVKVGTLMLGDQNANTTGLSINAIFNLNNGGTLKVQTIQPGATVTGTVTRTINWNNGMIKNYDAATDLTISNFGTNGSFVLAGAGSHTFDIDAGRLGEVNQAISGAGALSKDGAGTLTLNAANTFTGNTTVANGTLNLSASSSMAFVIGASGVNNKFDGTGTISLNGTLQLDLTNAGTGLGNTWQLVDHAALTEAYGNNFNLSGFTDDLDNTWSKTINSITYDFSEATGQLTVIGVPEPSAALLGGLGLLALLRRRRF